MPDYFTLEELRSLPNMGDAVKFPDDRCEAVAAALVSVIEREVGTSFVARTVTDEAHDGGGCEIPLRSGFVLSVTSATEDGVPVSDTLVARSGVLRRLSGSSLVRWARGYGNVLVTYESGYSAEPPADVKEQALKGTRAHLLATSDAVAMNERRTSISNEQGTVNFVVAGPDQPTGYPEVDAMILGWKRRLNVLGFA